MGKKNRQQRRESNAPKWQSADLNNRQFMHYYKLLKSLACSVYKWEGLPPEIDERFLELTLFQNALAIFFYESKEYGKYFATQGSAAGQINMYNNPTQYLAYGSNGFHKKLTLESCVPIWANYLREPMHNSILIYARRLADIDRTIDVNLRQQKTPLLITCEESQRLTMKNLYVQYEGNEPVIFGTDALGQAIANGGVQVFKTDSPYIVGNLMTDKARIWAEIMTFLGIDNANQDKKERLVSAEVSANDGQIEVCRLANLNARRQACDQINRMYPTLNISVNFNRDIASSNYHMSQDTAAQMGTISTTRDLNAEVDPESEVE